MIIQSEQDLTAAVLAEVAHTPDARLREVLAAAVTQLHAFARDVRLTEAELRSICMFVAQAGQATNAAHNEVVLGAGSLGLSALVCLINNGAGGATTANLMGPFWRQGSPATLSGGSIVRSPTPGAPLFVQAWVRDTQGAPVLGAEVDVWHSSAEGFYENQDPSQAEMNLRGKFTTDAAGGIAFRSIKPVGYPVPVNGPVGALLRAQGRHNLRPAHIHFMIHKPGFKTQFSQVYSSDDPHLETDVQFGVTRALVGQYVLHHEPAGPPQGRIPECGARRCAGDRAAAADVSGDWYSLEHHFTIEPGVASLPAPPITAKTTGERPALMVLTRAE